MIDFLRGLLQREAARVIAYASAAAVAGAMALGAALGVELSAEHQAAVAALATLVVTEAIRRVVWSADTHNEDMAAAYQAGIRDSLPD